MSPDEAAAIIAADRAELNDGIEPRERKEREVHGKMETIHLGTYIEGLGNGPEEDINAVLMSHQDALQNFIHELNRHGIIKVTTSADPEAPQRLRLSLWLDVVTEQTPPSPEQLQPEEVGGLLVELEQAEGRNNGMVQLYPPFLRRLLRLLGHQA